MLICRASSYADTLYHCLHLHCDKSFPTVEALQHHLSTHFEPTNPSSQAAYGAPQAFSITGNTPSVDSGNIAPARAVNHAHTPTPRPRPVCPACSCDFSRPSDLERHAKKHQFGAKIYRCFVEGCGYQGSYGKDKLRQHQKNCQAGANGGVSA